MKKYILPAALLFAAFSCSKEIPQSDLPLPEEELCPVEFTASKAGLSGSDGTKTLLTEDGILHWSLGDALSVFDVITKIGHQFESLINETNAALATFSGQLPASTREYCAIYPYNSEATMSGSVVTTTLPAVQTAVAGSFDTGADLAFASGDRSKPSEEGLTFNHLCALISFKMPSYVDGAAQVVVSSKNGEELAGSVQVNTSSSAISSVSGATSVTLGGNALAQGETYYVAIAPGTYTNGLTFTVTTAAGNTYTAQTTKTLPARAGVLYPLGTLGLVLGNTPVVTIAHTTNSAGELSGSTATLSGLTLPAELASMVSGWNVTLVKNNTVYRTLSSNAGTMSVSNGWTYLPQGNYDIVANYTLADGRTKTLRGTATSPAPGFTVAVGGNCSYDWYAGTNGVSRNVSTANSKDNATIYSPSVKVNVASTLLNDSKYGASWSYSYDGGAATTFSGNSASIPDKTGQSWAAHTLTATCNFDGVTKNASRTFHITGLPFVDNAPGTNSLWSRGQSCWNDGNSINIGDATNHSLKVSISFYCPGNINISFASSVKIHTTTRVTQNGVTVKAGGTQIVNQDGPKGTGVEQSYNLSANGTLTSANPTLEYEGKRWSGNSHVWINSASVLYR